MIRAEVTTFPFTTSKTGSTITISYGAAICLTAQKQGNNNEDEKYFTKHKIDK
jgi:hypothetical protein